MKLEDLSKEVQDEINSNTRHFIAQTIAYKKSSASTKTRICWDSSRSSKQSASLNSILMKGAAEYSVAKMLIKFRENKYGISADISKFYNNLKLDAKHYHLHLAMWRPNLDPEEEAVIYVLLVHFYGIRSSGGLCLAAIKRIINYAREQNLETIARILEAAYVDDCNSSVSTKEEVETIKTNMPGFMRRHGFPIKGLACSGEAPPDELSEDGISVNVAGYKWRPEKDELKIITPKIFIGKKNKGRYAPGTKFFNDEVTLENITNFFDGTVVNLELIISKTAELYDPLGFAAPLKVFGNYIARRALIESNGNPLQEVSQKTRQLFLQYTYIIPLKILQIFLTVKRLSFKPYFYILSYSFCIILVVLRMGWGLIQYYYGIL